MAIKRLRYFNHQFLVDADFTDEQKYHMDMRRRLNRSLHTFGIGEGLEVVKKTDKIVTVRSGVAIDNLGREIILEAEQDVNLNAITTAVPAFITIAYGEQPSDPSGSTSAPGDTRFTEAPILQVVTTAPPIDGSVVQLARIILTAGGPVPGNPNDAFDGGVRQAIGPRGERGLASIDGVSNPGGNVDLLAGAGIVITPDQTNRRITIAASGAQGLASLDGVSNPGGNIDLLSSGAIVITPNDANNTITIGESHSGLTNNPHATTAAQIGALLATAYDLRQRAFATSAPFSQANATGATQTINFSFQPRVVLVTGIVEANLGGRTYGGGISALALIDSAGTITQRGVSFGVTRFSAATPPAATDWLSRSFGSGSALFATDIIDDGVSPNQREVLSVSITSLTATGFVVTFTRTPVAPRVVLSNFNIVLQMLGMG